MTELISGYHREILKHDRKTWSDEILRNRPARHHPPTVALFWQRFMTAKENDLTHADWKFADYLAGTWNTCACGSINDGLPRNDLSHEPLDAHLERLGMNFLNQIQAKYLPEAQDVFLRIHERAIEVLKLQGADAAKTEAKLDTFRRAFTTANKEA